MNNGPLCPKCNTPNSYTSVFCSRCGQKLPWGDAVGVTNQPVAPTPPQFSAPSFFQAPAPVRQAPKNSNKPWIYGGIVLGVFYIIGSIGAYMEGNIKATKQATQAAVQAKKERARINSPAYRAKAKAQIEAQAKVRRVESSRRSKALREAGAKKAKAGSDEIKIVQENANSIKKLLDKANGTSDGQLFSGYNVEDGDKLMLTTTPDFDALPYRARLQIASLLYKAWGALCDRTTDHKTPLFHMNDVAGNEVGGRGVLSGAWVVEQ